MNAHRRTRAPRHRQAGVVLMIGMIMLLMVTLVAVGVVRLSLRHTQVVNNEQTRTEANAAADYALDLVLNQQATTWGPYKSDTGKSLYVNLGVTAQDDSAAVSTAVTVKKLACKRPRVLKNAELISESNGVAVISSENSSCWGGAGNNNLTLVNTAAVGSSAGDSLCATVLYEMQAESHDAQQTSASASVVQGVEVRTDVTSMNSDCS